MLAILWVALTISLLSGDSLGGASEGVSVQRITVSAIGAKTARMPLSFDGQEVMGQIKGTLTVVQTIDIDEGQFANVGDLRARLRQAWCPPSFRPSGEITFSAGRNVSANLGVGSLANQIVSRIDLTYQRTRDGSSQPLTIHCSNKKVVCIAKTCK